MAMEDDEDAVGGPAKWPGNRLELEALLLKC